MEKRIKSFFERYEPAILKAGFEKSTAHSTVNNQFQQYKKDGVIVYFIFRNERDVPLEIYADSADDAWVGIDKSSVLIEIFGLLNIPTHQFHFINKAISIGIEYYPIYVNESINKKNAINTVNDYFRNVQLQFPYCFVKKEFEKLTKVPITYFVRSNLFLYPDGFIGYNIILSYLNLNFNIKINDKNEFSIEYGDSVITSIDELPKLTEHVKSKIGDLIIPILKKSFDFDILLSSKSDIEKALELYSMQSI